jgi:hypothetical protein
VGAGVTPSESDCGVEFTAVNGGKYECNRPKGHALSPHYVGKHWLWVGNRVDQHEPFGEGEPRVITKKPDEPNF